MTASQRLVLHVGPHKTATTYLQNNFAQYRAQLDAAGWIYPDAVGIAPDNPEAHHDLSYRAEAYFWRDGNHHHQLLDLASLLKRTGKNLLLSAEGFSMWALSQYHRLADLLGFDRIEVVYALRDPTSLMHSYWAEEVKQGMTASFPDRIAGATLDPLRARLLNPMIDLDPLIASDRIVLRLLPFEVLNAAGTDLFSHVCAAVLGLDAWQSKVKGRINAGFPVEQTEFLRMLTLMRFAGQTGVGPGLRMAFIRKTTPGERAAWNSQIRVAAVDALRQLPVSADAFFRVEIESRIAARAGAFFTIPLQDGALFDRRDKALCYYDDYLFWNNDVVRAISTSVLDRLALSFAQDAKHPACAVQ